jgi:hypothetical protein
MLTHVGNLKRKLEAIQAGPGNEVVFVTGAKTLKPYETNINATANTTYTSYAITLPAVAEAAGLLFTIMATIADAQAITLQDQDDSDDYQGDWTLDADNDSIALYSDGRKWIVVNNEIA